MLCDLAAQLDLYYAKLGLHPSSVRRASEAEFSVHLRCGKLAAGLNVCGCEAGTSLDLILILCQKLVIKSREVQGLEERGWKRLGTKSSEISL